MYIAIRRNLHYLFCIESKIFIIVGFREMFLDSDDEELILHYPNKGKSKKILSIWLILYFRTLACQLGSLIWNTNSNHPNLISCDKY